MNAAEAAGHAATCRTVRSRTGRSRPTSSSTRCSSCSTTGTWPGRGPSRRRVEPAGGRCSPRPGGHCRSTPSSGSSPARRILRTIRHPCHICCPRRSCSGTPPPGCSSTRVSSALTPRRWPARQTPCERRSGTASPALARSAPSGRTRPTAEAGSAATRTPTTSRPPSRHCGDCAHPRTRNGRPRCDSPSTGRTPDGPRDDGAASAPPTPRARGRWGMCRSGLSRACWRDRPRGARARTPPCRGRAGRSPPRDLRFGHRHLAGPPLVRLTERGPRRPRPRRRRSGGAGGATMRHDRQEWPLVRGGLLC